MRVTTHFLSRLRRRFLPHEVNLIVDNTKKAVRRHGGKSTAVVALRLRNERGQAWTQWTCGDTVIVIVRDNVAVTAFLRRSTQTLNTNITRTNVLVDEFSRQGMRPV
tara:strand:- start:1259 stop:1579 length:321 start_codon:yes stop_codon:yes gene_type:complete